MFIDTYLEITWPKISKRNWWSCLKIYQGPSHKTLVGGTGGEGARSFFGGVFPGELGGEGSGLAGESRTMTCSGAGGCWGPGPRISKMSDVAFLKTGARGRRGWSWRGWSWPGKVLTRGAGVRGWSCLLARLDCNGPMVTQLYGSPIWLASPLTFGAGFPRGSMRCKGW